MTSNSETSKLRSLFITIFLGKPKLFDKTEQYLFPTKEKEKIEYIFQRVRAGLSFLD